MIYHITISSVSTVPLYTLAYRIDFNDIVDEARTKQPQRKIGASLYPLFYDGLPTLSAIQCPNAFELVSNLFYE